MIAAPVEKEKPQVDDVQEVDRQESEGLHLNYTISSALRYVLILLELLVFIIRFLLDFSSHHQQKKSRRKHRRLDAISI